MPNVNITATQKIRMYQKTATGWNLQHPETEVAQIVDLSTTLNDYLLKAFSGFTAKTTIHNNDLVAINDSEASYAVKKITMATLIAACGDSHNKGWYATSAALISAHSTGTNGDWAVVGATDTVWVWDSDSSTWVDTDTHGEVTSVNGQTGAVTIATPGTLITNATTGQTASAGEAMSGNITLHKISKTGSWNDLLDKPTITDPGTLDTTATTAQTTAAAESLGGSVVLNRISKTAHYQHLLNTAGSQAKVRQIETNATEPTMLETGDFWYEVIS